MSYLTPDTPTGFVEVRFSVPNTLTPHVFGGLASLLQPWKWQQHGTLTPDEAVQLLTDVFLTGYQGPDVGHAPLTVDVPALRPTGSQGGITQQVWLDSFWGVKIYHGNGVNNYLEYTASLGVGEWSLSVWTARDNNKGIVTAYIDGTQVGTYDGYSVTKLENQVRVIPGILIASDGNHLCRLTVTSKNANSSAYWQEVNHIRFTRTG